AEVEEEDARLGLAEGRPWGGRERGGQGEAERGEPAEAQPLAAGRSGFVEAQHDASAAGVGVAREHADRIPDVAGENYAWEKKVGAPPPAAHLIGREGEMPNADCFGGRSMLANAVPSLLEHVRRLAASTSSDEQL